MHKSRKPEQFIKTPGYPGGNEALSQFIRQNLRYPKEALEKGIEGVVVVEFDYNEDGQVLRTRVKKGLGHGCDEEAQRIVKMLRFRKVRQRKMRVTYHSTINIHFHRPKKSQGDRSIQYTVTPAGKKKEDPPGKSSGYGYTIKLG